jgi:hypothetical protein
LLVAQPLYVQIDLDAQRWVLTGHGVHGSPVGKLLLELIAILEDDVELVEVSRVHLQRDALEPTHLFCFGSPFLLYPEGSVTREDTMARAALEK